MQILETKLYEAICEYDGWCSGLVDTEEEAESTFELHLKCAPECKLRHDMEKVFEEFRG